MICFYALSPKRLQAVSAIPEDFDIRLWRPEDGLPPRGPKQKQNLLWWLLSKGGLFSRPGFAETTLWARGRMVQRLIVTPGWWRFPFMAGNDLQIGDVWTAPEYRGQGLAQTAVGEAQRLVAGQTQRLWYVTDSRNEASIRLAQSCGFAFVGTGVRTAPFGLRIFGRFRLIERAISAAGSSPSGSRPTGRRPGRSPAG